MAGFLSLNNKWFTGTLFSILFIYLLLRAIWVEPLLDELGTYYWYIQTGTILGGDAVLDANNHLLNSFFSHYFYRLLGDQVLVYRLFALLTFPLYFFATRKLVKDTISSVLPAVLVFLALNSIHWIFDYFGFSRGYGPALAFFFAALSVMISWKTSLRPRSLLWIVLLLLAAILSNLSFFVPCFFVICFIALQYLAQWKTTQNKARIQTLLVLLLYLLACVPLYVYLNKLKKAGALWWGSRDGFWEVTGKSLCKYVFFSENPLWKISLLVICLACLVLIVRHGIQKGLRDLIASPAFFIPGILALSIASAFFMAIFLEVNYPMDRVAMYMVPLFLLSVGILFAQLKITSYLLLAYCWFPLSFVIKMNLDTSVFSPEDRIHRTFYANIKKLVKPNDILSADYVSHMSYAYLTRQEPEAHMANEYREDSLCRGDYHINWYEGVNWPGYRCVLEDPVSKTKLYQKIKPAEKIRVFDTVIPLLRTSAEYIVFKELDLLPFRGKYLQTHLSATVESPKGSMKLHLYHNAENSQKVARTLTTTPFYRYFGVKKQYRFSFPGQYLKIADDDNKLFLFLFNGDKNELVLRDVKIKVYEQKNGG